MTFCIHALTQLLAKGCGDVFVGAICYGLVSGLPFEKMLPLAAFVGGSKCMGSGLSSIPYRAQAGHLL